MTICFIHLFYGKEKNKPEELGKELQRLFDIYDVDPDGLKKAGFYEYVLSKDRTLIWHRAFSDKQQNQVYKEQGEKCAVCKKKFKKEELEAHHKLAFADGGETVIGNCQMLCKDCHADITAKQNQG